MNSSLRPPSSDRAWSRRAKQIVSLILVVHLLAITAEPLRFFSYGTTRGSSPAMDPIRSALAPYVEFAFLNHGYFFFAPEPGPSHLIQCSLEFPSGEVSNFRFPDKRSQWPRLYYHRIFMYSEFLNQIHAPPVDPILIKQATPSEADGWSSSRSRFEMVRDSMQQHLATRYAAKSARIERLRHILPGSDVVLKQQLKLDDPSLIVVLPDQLETPAELVGPTRLGPQPIIPTPTIPWSLDPRPNPYQSKAPGGNPDSGAEPVEAKP